MNLNTTKFFNSTDVNISSRMNEYLKKNFGYEVNGDISTLREAKKSLELEQVELKDTGYMNQKYVENMLMIETISSLLKAHGEKLDLDDFSKKSPESISKQKKSIQPTLGDNPLGEDEAEMKLVLRGKRDRAHRIEAVMKKGGYTDFQDLLTDMMHYAQETDKDFGMELDRAKSEWEDQSEFPNREIDRFGPEEDNYDQPKESIKEDDDDDELINKVAEWIYHESSEPISEIEYLLKKSDAVGEYMDAVSESKEKVKEDDEEKGPEHYRWKNDSQLAVALGRIESAMEELDHAIEYRGENSAKFFNNGDKAGVGSLMSIKGTLQKVLDRWEKDTEFYGM